jgi:hypothetical protein
VKTGHYLAFGNCVPLPKRGQVRSARVEASLPDGSPIGTRDLHIKRVDNRVYEPNGVYGIVLLSLEEEPPPTDPNGKHGDPESARNIVLDALKGCQLYDPADPGQSHSRFNLAALEMWTVEELDKELGRLGVANSSPERKFITLADNHEKEPGPQIDLGVYGHITEDANSLEIVLRLFDVKSKHHPFPKIDVFGSKSDPDWHTDGLIAKFHQTVRRVSGRVTDVPQPGVILVDCGSDDGVFRRMDVRLYESQDGLLSPVCRGSTRDVRRGRSEVRVTNTSEWNYVNDSQSRGLIRVIGK